ncbi:hypothetical protein [Streptacidiphilus fuscans]|uniref:Uncharacterized protein n=1 Tax=Streptacidiphilus fuscans TaxID=2789292 RepID=A0A931FDC0_9ACTN|nr:hypothetical protein [Streptacidiphilus fuscans]MBF9069408.1 hypothetical protein [Streptacidiphilus fuscans]
MHGSRKLTWLGLTPEPERELPYAVARLRSQVAGAGPGGGTDGEAEERRRIERLILHGSRQTWLRYLGEVTQLVVDAAVQVVPADPETALVVGEVVLSHHQLLIGLPGDAYQQAAADRALLSSAVRRLRERLPPGRSTTADPSRPDPSHLELSRPEPSREAGTP